MKLLKVNMTYEDNQCYLNNYQSTYRFNNKYFDEERHNISLFHLCDITGDHMDGYYLFNISPLGCHLYSSVSKGEPMLKPSVDNSGRDSTLLVIGVDEI